MINSIPDKTSFNGWLHGTTEHQIATHLKPRWLGPAHVCPFGDKEFIRIINSISKKKSPRVEQSGSGYDKILTFEFTKKDLAQNSSFWSKISPMLMLGDSQKKILKNKDISLIKFQLSKDDFLFTASENTINILNIIRIKKFKNNMKKLFSSPKEQEWLDDYFKTDKKK